MTAEMVAPWLVVAFAFGLLAGVLIMLWRLR